MPPKAPTTYLLASPDPALLTGLEQVLLDGGARVEIALTLEAALAAIAVPEPPTLALIDTNLPGMDPRMNLGRLLAEARAEDSASGIAIVLISDTVTQEWIDRVAEGVADDLILRSSGVAYWRLRIEMVLRKRDEACEVETLREAQVLSAQTDRLTGVYNRETILSMLFRETDRVQRMKSSLSLLLLDIDDFGHWNSRLGNEACDDLLCQVARRITRLLRSYDLLGRAGKDEYLTALPGCSTANAVLLAERMRVDVFSLPFRVSDELIRLSACFGIACSRGRSPVVVLREAETALQAARSAGPESICCFGDGAQSCDTPSSFLFPSQGDEQLAW